MKPVFFVSAALLLLLLANGKNLGGIGALKKSRFLPPYSPDGSATFSDMRGRSGVYLIKHNGVIVYVGYSSTNLYRTLYRHFQRWDHPSQQVVTYAGAAGVFSVRVLLCSPSQAKKYEVALVRKYRPRDNARKMSSLDLSDKEEKRLVVNYGRAEDAPF